MQDIIYNQIQDISNFHKKIARKFNQKIQNKFTGKIQPKI